MNSGNTVVVKYVNSGDSITVRGRPISGPPPEKTVRLAGIAAPHFGNKAAGREDEAWAWESRDFLRSFIIGKDVRIITEHKTTTGAEFVRMTLVTTGEDISEKIVATGWAKVKDGIANDQSAEHLVAAQKAAMDAFLGIWDSSAVPKAFNWISSVGIDDDGVGAALLKANKGKEIPAIIEQVRDASSFKICLLQGNDANVVPLMLSGLRAVSTNEPFGDEAKFFVESRLLQKNVNVVLEGMSNGSFIGTIIHPAGNISIILLQEGFARVVDWSLQMATVGSEKLRMAEKAAKDKRLRIWKDVVSKTATAGSQKAFTGKVIRIISGECLLVLVNGTERKIWLSGIRQPKLTRGTGTNGQPNPNVEVGYNYDARELLRSKLIGKNITIRLDYVKPATDEYEEKACATILLNDKNIAEILVSRGFASVIRYKKDDMNRPACYDELLIAEDKAKASKKGIHSDKEEPVHRFVDASESAVKANSFLLKFLKAGRMEGIVEHISNSSRFRVFVPKENCRITLVLAGLSSPRSARSPTEKSEPFAKEGLDWARLALNQRDVEVEVESVDRAGGFLGYMFLDGENVGLMVLSQGLASLSRMPHRYGDALSAAETEAKREKLGIWSIERERVLESAEDASSVIVRSETLQAVVSEVASASTIYCQSANDVKMIESLMSNLQVSCSALPASGLKAFKAGDMVVVKSSHDGKWYRAKITNISKDGNASLLLVDYGHVEVIPSDKLQSMPSTVAEAARLPAQAKEYKLALIRCSSDEESAEYAAQKLYTLTMDKAVTLKVNYVIKGTPFVTITTASGVNVNQCLLEEGYVIVEPAHVLKSLPPELNDLKLQAQSWQETARKERRNLWRYGDFLPDDDEFE